jgi:hypothetical protein
MPPEGASEQGFFDRSFENKKKAVEYQKRVKAKFPNAPCALVDYPAWRLIQSELEFGAILVGSEAVILQIKLEPWVREIRESPAPLETGATISGS